MRYWDDLEQDEQQAWLALQRERDEARARNDEARAIIQYEYDRHVEYWGNDGSTLKDDGDYVPALAQVRKMYCWLSATPPHEEAS